MTKVENKKIITTLSKNIFKFNKQRNIIGIFAIVLTTILFTTTINIANEVFTVNKEYRKYISGVDYDIEFKDITDKEVSLIENHPSIKKLGKSRSVGFLENEKFKIPVLATYFDETYFNSYIGFDLKGNLPKNANEIVMNKYDLDILGIDAKIGEIVPLKLKANVFDTNKNLTEKIIEKDFKLTGYYIVDKSITSYDNLHLSIVSNDFVNETFNNSSGISGITGSGSYRLGVYLKNSKNQIQEAENILNDIGYQSKNKDADNYIRVSTSQSYSNIPPIFIIAVCIILILFFISGYLIIYNIFQISLLKDIKTFGQLKTIGTTRKQLKKIMLNQVYYMSIIGIPIGLICGYFLSKLGLPILTKNLSVPIKTTSINIVVFIICALFSFITVFISCNKPMNIVSKISPIESIRYTIVNTNKKIKKGKNGSKIYNLAFQNLKREREKTILVIISLALSGILINCIHNYIISLDMDMYVSDFMVCDFRIQDSLSNFSIDGNGNRGIPKNFIDEITNSEKIIEQGPLYTHNPNVEEIYINENYLKLYSSIIEKNGKEINIIKTPNSVPENFHRIYGVSEIVFNNGFKLIDGELDWEKFNSGNYIIVTKVYSANKDTIKYSVGDKLKIKYADTGLEKEYEVLAVVDTIKYFDSVSHHQSINLAIPSQKFETLFPNQKPLDYWINVKEDEIVNYGEFLEPYQNKEDLKIKIVSKNIFEEIFKEMNLPISLGGGMIAGILFLIGILNYTNIIFSNIYTRRKEFAMLRSIGLSQKQLRKLLIFEGLWYCVFSSITIIIFSTILSVFAVKAIGNFPSTSFYFNYKFSLLPSFIIIFICFILVYIISNIGATKIKNNNIIEELRIE